MLDSKGSSTYRESQDTTSEEHPMLWQTPENTRRQLTLSGVSAMPSFVGSAADENRKPILGAIRR